jgi:hypothetical protein
VLRMDDEIHKMQGRRCPTQTIRLLVRYTADVTQSGTPNDRRWSLAQDPAMQRVS